MIRSVLIVSERPVCTEVLAEIAARRFIEATIHVETALAGFVDKLVAIKPDIALVVINGAGPGASAALPALISRLPHCPVVVLDDRFDRSRFEMTLASGAKGYIPLTSSRDLIDAAIGLVAAGGIHFQMPATRSTSASLMAALSSRQIEVLRLVASGKTNHEISQVLGITLATAKLHVHAILTATGTRNRTEVAIMAREEGLL